MRRRRKLLYGLIVAFGLLALAEGGLRLAGFSHRPGEHVPAEAKLHELTDDRMYVPDETLLWRLKPSSVIDIQDPAYPRFRTNALGLRGPEIGATKAEQELRVLCLGDSVTFGMGLPEGETVPEFLQGALSADLPDGFASVAVLNGAVSGYSSVQGERMFARLADTRPDVVVFWFGMNDAKPAAGVPDSRLRLPSPGATRVWEALSGLRLAQFAVWLVRGGGGGTRVSPDEYAAIVGRLRAAEQEGRGPKVVFVRFPEQMDVTAGQLRDVLERARAAGAERVRTPPVVMLPYAPAPPQVRLGMTIENDAQGKLAVFGGRAATTGNLTLAEVEQRLARVVDWKAALDCLLATLPEDALDYGDLFGERPPHAVFTDNCHLTTDGARAAADVLAVAVRKALARR